MELNLFRIKSLMAKVWDEQKKHYLLIWLVYFGVMAVSDGRNLYLVLADVCAG